MAALPIPVMGRIDALRPFCHVADDDWPLVIGWLVEAMRPERPFTILSFKTRAGSAKSTNTGTSNHVQREEPHDNFISGLFCAAWHCSIARLAITIASNFS
jgi:hypothetical protein